MNDSAEIYAAGGGKPCGTASPRVSPVPVIASVAAVSAYAACQMLADISSLKIGNAFGLAVDMGTFIYPITFTLRDLVHRLLGKTGAQTAIVASAVVSLFMAGYLRFCAAIPADVSWPLHNEFAAIFAPVWRLVVASVVAEMASEFADTEVYHGLVSRGRPLWLSSLASNSVSVPVDSMIFAVGAFAFALPWSAIAEIFCANLLVKAAVGAISVPLVYLVPLKYGRRTDMTEKSEK